LQSAIEYMTDAAQRSVLFLDVLRQRGNNYQEHVAKAAPHVLNYEVELLIDGRTLDRPVNYALVRVIPPAGIVIDPTLRPFVIIDPRAGHGPGIGGFKSDSEIGVAFRAGNPCYFIGFLPEPVPGQTIEDIAHAEAIFLERVISLHPQADGKPCVIGNCQAGWAVMILAALRPELFGPLIVAGAPLSYWAGIRGKYPMRYSGGLLGGSWLTALASDLGNGKFDGAWLVQNFENQNPANTFWTKPYNLYSKVDTEAPRYLEFERWWGGHVNLNAEEIQFIVDELFINNNLSSGAIKTENGTTIDLRSIRSPIVIFCSRGDNITPPQQALGWILDLYDDVDEIRSYGQTIVYTIHETIGHLGIFVSSSVARKEHGEFSSNIDLIDALPPGLYEAVFTERTPDLARAELVSGEWLMRCEPRTLEDIRALGGNDAADERKFATAARVSQTNLALYRTFAQPAVRTFMNSQFAALLQQFHPLRLQYAMFSDENPFMAQIAALANSVRENRRSVEADNPFLALQENVSRQIVATLDRWRDANEALAERIFHSIYGSPTLQVGMGIDPKSTKPLRKAGKSPLHKQFVEFRIRELRSRMATGGLRAGVIRSAVYVGMSHGSFDERSFEFIRHIRLVPDGMPRLTLTEFKALLREQFFMLLIDEPAALAAIPSLLPTDTEERQRALTLLREILGVRGELTGEAADRLRRIIQLFDVKDIPADVHRIRRRDVAKGERSTAS
jgi:pimeloyl-ACP methyl ester carboxylesterase